MFYLHLLFNPTFLWLFFLGAVLLPSIFTDEYTGYSSQLHRYFPFLNLHMGKRLAPSKRCSQEILTKLPYGQSGMEQHGFLLRKNPEKNRTSTSIKAIASGYLATKLSKVFLSMLELGLAKN
jgi:hypothetical protein